MFALRLGKPDAEGVTVSAKRAQLEKAGKSVPEGVDMPEAVGHIWGWFLEANQGRQNSGFGPCALSWVDMAAFFAFMGLKPAPWEVRIFRVFDQALLHVYQPETKGE